MTSATQTTTTNNPFDINPIIGPLHDDPEGYLAGLGGAFDDGEAKMLAQLQVAYNQLAGDDSNPAALAYFQQYLSEYNLYRNAQSSTVKAMKDTDSSIVSNFR